MSKIVNIKKIQDLIVEIRNTKILLDSDIADLYEVETRDVNKSVKNNPDKFPDGYVFELSKDELEVLRWKFSTAKLSKTRVMPKAFTEKGLYMLATILKSKNSNIQLKNGKNEKYPIPMRWVSWCWPRPYRSLSCPCG